MKNLYAAGECACQYHGSNRLGGNSLLGALYGGSVAAKSVMEDAAISDEQREGIMKKLSGLLSENQRDRTSIAGSYSDHLIELREILRNGLGIMRTEESLLQSISQMDALIEQISDTYDDTATEAENKYLMESCILGKAMLMSALGRKESRGAHFRGDYPTENISIDSGSYRG